MLITVPNLRLRPWINTYGNQDEIDFSRPGKPIDNAYIESFDGKLRTEWLNENRLLSLATATDKIRAWRMDYNDSRSHSALRSLAPSEYAVLSENNRTA